MSDNPRVLTDPETVTIPAAGALLIYVINGRIQITMTPNTTPAAKKRLDEINKAAAGIAKAKGKE